MSIETLPRFEEEALNSSKSALLEKITSSIQDNGKGA